MLSASGIPLSVVLGRKVIVSYDANLRSFSNENRVRPL